MSDAPKGRPEDRDPDLTRQVTVSLDARLTLDDLVTMVHSALTDDARMTSTEAEDSLVEFIIALDNHVADWDFTLRLAAHLENERLAYEADRDGEDDRVAGPANEDEGEG